MLWLCLVVQKLVSEHSTCISFVWKSSNCDIGTFTAAQAINMGHPFVKLKPLTQATIESRARAKKSAAHLQPYRQRPETCAALARRLVTGALGVRLSTAREELENERRVLREAKGNFYSTSSKSVDLTFH